MMGSDFIWVVREGFPEEVMSNWDLEDNQDNNIGEGSCSSAGILEALMKMAEDEVKEA